ncbi:MAG: nitroreductase family protein [Clostridia bacterium]|nr:nitroreductase family protein [Clostridia bacterium]MBQ4624359.1 nitroreductase family protein [Clostridia bacterium]MBQ6990668.1 nitroreductase family protein [Clostridia bacterium]
MNESIKLILNRQSVRSYEAKPVAPEDVEIILECGKYAATAMGLQPWHFTVVRSREKLDKITAENKRIILKDGGQVDERYDNFRGAPMAILISGETDTPSAQADCAIATENMALAANALGIASLFIGSFAPAFSGENKDEFMKEFGIPQGFQPYYALSLGYRKGELEERKPRRENLVNYVD